MSMKSKGLAGLVLAAVCLYLVVTTPWAEPPRAEPADPPAADGEQEKAEVEPEPVDPVTEAGGRSAVEEDPLETALMTTVTVKGVDARDGRPEELLEPWPSQGITSEFDLDPALAVLARPYEYLRVDWIEVELYHPQYLLEKARVTFASGVQMADGKIVHEVRAQMTQPKFWPEFNLSVLDAKTREHLDDIELRLGLGVGNALWGRNGRSALIGDDLRSPIELMGGRAGDELKPKVAGVALFPTPGESPTLIGLNRRLPVERGVQISARAPGYAWGSTSIDVSKGERELLLERAATLKVGLTNVQLERYAELETVPMLCVYRLWEGGGYGYIRFERLTETLVTDGLQLPSVVPGNYAVAVELGDGVWTEKPVLAREEFTLVAGEARELVLTLADPPAPPQRASLGGVVSIPAFGGEEKVRLQLYFQPTQSWRNPDVEFALADLERVDGALPSWAFQVEGLPVGMYRIQLMPFLKVWMVDLTAAGREDLQLEVPDLSEVEFETVDGRTGERVFLDQFYFRNQQPHPAQKQNDWAKAETIEPGRFRIWTTPGTIRAWPRLPTGSDIEYGGIGQDFTLVPGFQSVRFELEPVYAMRFEFREDGVTLPVGDPGMYVTQNIRAVGHEGRVTSDGLQTSMRVAVSEPGVYEIRFDGLDPDLYHPMPSRLVDVRAGLATEVVVELLRK